MGGLPSVANLSDKQAEFVRQLPLCEFNIVQAYYAAGYKAASDASAEKSAQRFMSSEKIQSALAMGWYGKDKGREIEAPRILKEIGRIAFADIRDAFYWNKSKLYFKNSDEMTDDIIASISGIKVTERKETERVPGATTIEIKFWDKLKALEMAARHLGMFERDQHVSLDVNYTTELPSKAPTEAEWLAQVNAIEAASREID